MIITAQQLLTVATSVPAITVLITRSYTFYPDDALPMLPLLHWAVK